MDNKLIFRLKEFYVLEKFQVEYYKAQLDSETDKYYRKVFELMLRKEQTHVDYFKNLIEGTGESVPSFISSIFELAGKLLGEGLEASGQFYTCTFGVKLENKARAMYQDFIDECNEKNYDILQNDLMGFALDEEFHSLWLNNYAKQNSSFTSP